MQQPPNENIIVKKEAVVFAARKNDFGGGLKNGNVLFGIHDIVNPSSDIYNHKRLGKIWEDSSAREKVLADDSFQRISGKWMYGGALFNHFGHFLAESVHRLWAFNHLKDKINGIVFHIPIHWFNKKPHELPKFMNETLELYGISKVQIKFIKEHTIVEKLFIPRAGTFLGEVSKDWYLEELKSNISSIAIPDNNKYNKIYMSRKNYLHKGRLLGLDYFEKFFRENGFKIVLPETLSLKEQLYIVYNARHIIFEEGSAIHLLDLLPPLETNIFMIRRRTVAYNYIDSFLEEKSLSLNVYKYVLESKLYFKGDRRDNISSRLINFSDFSNWLIENNLIDRALEDLSIEKFAFVEMKDLLEYIKVRIGENENEFSFLSFRGLSCQ